MNSVTQQIEQATAAFRAILEEQLARQNEMEKGAVVKDFSKLSPIRVGICAGDGIGPI